MSVQEVLAGGLLRLAGPSLRLLPRTAMHPPADEQGKWSTSCQAKGQTNGNCPLVWPSRCLLAWPPIRVRVRLRLRSDQLATCRRSNYHRHVPILSSMAALVLFRHNGSIHIIIRLNRIGVMLSGPEKWNHWLQSCFSTIRWHWNTHLGLESHSTSTGGKKREGKTRKDICEFINSNNYCFFFFQLYCTLQILGFLAGQGKPVTVTCEVKVQWSVLSLRWGRLLCNACIIK